MAEIVKEVIVSEGVEKQPITSLEQPNASAFQTIQYLIYFFFGAVDILLLARLILKVLGANTSSDFVMFIYNLTNLSIAPFEGIFRNGVAQGVETRAVLEPATIVAIIVYAALAWGIVKLVQVLSGKQQAE